MPAPDLRPYLTARRLTVATIFGVGVIFLAVACGSPA